LESFAFPWGEIGRLDEFDELVIEKQGRFLSFDFIYVWGGGFAMGDTSFVKKTIRKRSLCFSVF
jgi:hypothetical protein